MDGGDTHQNDMLVESDGGPDVVCNMESTETPGASTSDENENCLDGKKSEPSNNSDCVIGTPATVSEDSINNNEHCSSQGGPPGSRSGCEEPEENKNAEGLSSSNQRDCESARVKDKLSSGKRNSKSKKGLSSVDTPMLSQEMKSADPVQETNISEGKTSSQPRDQKQILQFLLSLTEEEIEKTDTRILPHYLHQMAETYFQDEEYEKAIQFIHLERLYHEQLLANLSALQEKWETKWKTAVPDKLPSSRNSDKRLINEELERLEQICTLHQEPAVHKWKLMSAEKSLKCKDFSDLMGSEELRECAAASCFLDGDIHPGIEPKEHAKVKMTASLPWDGDTESLTEAASLGVASGKVCIEEQQPKAESTLENDTQSTESVCRPSLDGLCSEDTRKDNNRLQLGETELSEDAAQVTKVSKELKEELSKEPMVDRDTSYPLPDLKAKGLSQAEGNSFKTKHCDDSAERAESQLEYRVRGLEDDNERESIVGRTDSSTCNLSSDENTSRTCSNTCREETDKEMQNEMTEGYCIPLLNGGIKDSRDRLTNLEQQDDFDTLTEEDASYSPGEAALEDSFVSLDELAKRIEVEEIVPAEGLVSILKKRNDSETKNVVQIQQKPAKRRVRFQEMDDALDQDEVVGGSCLLLILLCVVTIFISVGGTALYCSFGDVESPVCTDFASNMDLYYTQVLQGIEELKHWVFPS